MKSMNALHTLRLGAAVCAALVVAGCASPDGAVATRSVRLEAGNLAASQALAGWTPSAANWPSGAWWNRYGDPQLDRIVTAALADSPTLHIAEARVREAMALSGVAESAQSLQVTGSARNSRQRYSENSTFPRPLAGSWKNYDEVMLNASYDFDFWGKNEAAFQGALDRQHAAEVEERAARLMVASGIVQAYLRLAALSDQLDLAERTLARRQAVLDLTRQRRAAGIDSDVELRQADGAVPASRQQIAALRENLQLVRQQLGALMGAGPDAGMALVRPQLALTQAAGLPSTVPAELLGQRPDIVAQRWRVEAAGREFKVARTQFYPNISLVSYIGLQSIYADNFLTSASRVGGLGPAVSLPLFDGGRLRSNLGARNAEYDIAVEQYNQTVIGAMQDVVGQLTSMTSVVEQRNEQQQATASSQAAYDLAQQRYKAGTGNFLQVLSAELQLQGQQRLLIDLQARGLALDASLMRALGGGVLAQAADSNGAQQ
jgi:NodT family efflux transporter outer membrane factor (OMF) lipoprotein